MIIFSRQFFVNVTCFPWGTSSFISNLRRYKEYQVRRNTSVKLEKVDPGDRVTLPMKFACNSELNYKHQNNIRYSLYTMIIFSRQFFVNVTCFPWGTSSFISNLRRYKEYQVRRNTSVKLEKVDPGDRVTLPMKFACNSELTLNALARLTLARSLGNPLSL